MRKSEYIGHWGHQTLGEPPYENIVWPEIHQIRFHPIGRTDSDILQQILNWFDDCIVLRLFVKM